MNSEISWNAIRKSAVICRALEIFFASTASTKTAARSPTVSSQTPVSSEGPDAISPVMSVMLSSVPEVMRWSIVWLPSLRAKQTCG